MGQVKIGALCWNQYTDWPPLLAAGVRADDLGYDTLWTWDHLYPIVGASDGPNYEGWLTITAWAQATTQRPHRPDGRRQHVPGADADGEAGDDARPHLRRPRHPRHRRRPGSSEEHEAFGLEFGSGFPERLRWLGEALPVMRGMLDGAEPTAPRRPLPRRVDAQPPGRRSRRTCRSASAAAARR